MILLIDTTKFVLHSKISTEMSIRRLNFFVHREEEYLSIMFYDNYVVLYELNSEKYCKITGHRSFVANTAYSQ